VFFNVSHFTLVQYLRVYSKGDAPYEAPLMQGHCTVGKIDLMDSDQRASLLHLGINYHSKKF
jgi:hypothetical protein